MSAGMLNSLPVSSILAYLFINVLWCFGLFMCNVETTVYSVTAFLLMYFLWAFVSVVVNCSARAC